MWMMGRQLVAARNQTVDILGSQLYVEAPLVPKSWASEFAEAQPIVVLSSALSVPLTPYFDLRILIPVGGVSVDFFVCALKNWI